MMPVFSLENLIIIGETLGPDCPLFDSLFASKPWLEYTEPNLAINVPQAKLRANANLTAKEFESLLRRLATVLI